jgi:hypothetical protein
MCRPGSMIRSKEVASDDSQSNNQNPDNCHNLPSLSFFRDNRMVWCCENISRQTRAITKLLRFHPCPVYVIAKALTGMRRNQESTSFHPLVRYGTLIFVLRFRVVLYEIPCGYRTVSILHFFFISSYVVVLCPSCFISVVCALVIRFLV